MKNSLSILLILWCFVSKAQQLPQFSQFQRNLNIINSGATGVNETMDLSIGGRLQWVGVTDAPKTTFLTFTAPLKFKPKLYNPGIRTSAGKIESPIIKELKFRHTIGGQVLADQYGAFRKYSLAGTYAFTYFLSKNTSLSVGIKAGLSNNLFLSDKAQVINVINPIQNNYVDPTYNSYLTNQSSKYMFDLGAGIYLKSKHLFFGIASDNLTKDLVEFGSGTANFGTKMHFNTVLGFKISLNKNTVLIPSFLVKYMQPAPLSIDGNFQIELKERLWFGLGYRHKDALIVLMGMKLNNRLRFGYSYDFSISRFNNYSSGGHELSLGLMIGR